MMNRYLQYPLDSFWISDKTKETITLGTVEDFQELTSPGDGYIKLIGKDEVMAVYEFEKFTIQIVFHPIQIYKKERVKKGEPIGFALDNHMVIRGTKVANETYSINPLTTLFVHKHQTCLSSVPFATPKILIR